jgi:hypothetical protein
MPYSLDFTPLFPPFPRSQPYEGKFPRRICRICRCEDVQPKLLVEETLCCGAHVTAIAPIRPLQAIYPGLFAVLHASCLLTFPLGLCSGSHLELLVGLEL